jgi:hypothetical protein
MEGRGWRGLKYNGNKKWACGSQGSFEMEEVCIASQDPQRTVALEKKIFIALLIKELMT